MRFVAILLLWFATHSVSAFKDKPEITGQRPVSTTAGQPVTIQLTDLQVDDPDGQYPNGFTLEVFPGKDYKVQGTTITPKKDFAGDLKVPVRVKSGKEHSDKFDMLVTVMVAQVEPPVITGQVPLSTDADTPITIELSHLVVSDPDSNYPDGFSLTVSPGTNYSATGNTITPSPGFAGTLSVPVVVNDGESNSNSFDVQITVNAAANQPPVITGQVGLSTPEATPIAIELSHLTVTDPDDSYPTGFTLHVSPGTNYTVNGTTVTPNAEFSGPLTVSVTVNDGTDSSAPFNLSITVSNVNTPPTITGQVALSTQQSTPLTLQLSHLTVTDPDNTYPTGFTLDVSTGANYSVSGTTVTPASGFSGTLSVPVTVNDGTDNSSPFNVAITVNAPANVPPSITGQIPLTITQNESLTLQLSHLTVTDPDDNYPNGFSLSVSTGANYTASGNVVTPAQDYTGTLFIPVTVNDGEANSNVFNLSVTVAPRQNVAPKITGQQPLSVQKNQSILIQLSHLTVSDPDNTFPNDFTLSVIGGANYSVAGDIVTPSQNFVGELSVRVTVNDGFVSSAPFNLRVTVNDVVVNQPPIITGQVGLTTFVNTPIAIGLSHLVVNDPDDTYPTGFTLKVAPGLNYTVSGTTVRPSANFVGTLGVSVTVNDGTDNSAPFSVRVQVVQKGELQITGQVPLSVLEDSVITITLANLKVSDPQGAYPKGFTLNLSPGENYAVEGTAVRPAPNYNGNLNVGVTVTGKSGTSPAFNMLIVVTAVNDAPVIEQMNPDPLVYNVGSGTVVVDDALIANDVDDQALLLAEVGIKPEYYQQGSDVIEFTETENIRGVFDQEEGILSLIGQASLEEYTTALRSVRFGFFSEGDTAAFETKVLYYRLNDGKTLSDYFERSIVMGETIVLDIPNVFTPNDDLSNDTWKITASKDESGEAAIVRVFNTRGIKVYEATGLHQEWDGKLNGEFLPSAVYYYTIDLNLSYRKTTYKGSVMIIR